MACCFTAVGCLQMDDRAGQRVLHATAGLHPRDHQPAQRAGFFAVGDSSTLEPGRRAGLFGWGTFTARWVLHSTVRIEIWSDVVCPWCYIGKRRLEKALAEFPPADDVGIVYRSFELDPTSPKAPTESVADYLGRKYGGGAAAGAEMVDRVQGIAAEEGMTWRHHEAQRVNTVDAHRLLHLARETRRQGELKEALLAAYFGEARNVADHATLREIAVGVGLEADRVEEVLASQQYADAVAADIAQARAYGATGVPFYVVDHKYGVSGAQPTEVFSQVLERAWSEGHPTLQMTGGEDAECGPDGCPI